jgi:hypothetical protein
MNQDPAFELPLTNPNATANHGQNGRVVFTDKGSNLPETFPGYQYEKTTEKDFEADMLRGNWEAGPLSQSFFSADNIKIIQNAIRRDVFEKSQPKGYVIDDQSADELKIIMRALYYQYAKNQPFDVPGQVNELNKKVVDWSAPHILSAVDHYHYYLNDISHMPIPLAREMNLSSAGSKSLPLNQFI